MVKHSSGHEPTSPEERLQHDIEELEGGTGWGGVIRWVLILGLAGGVGVAMYFLGGNRPPAPKTSASGAVIIEIMEPSSGRLAAAPARFRWETVAGRNDYMFRILEKGNPTPVVERPVRDNSTNLTPEESQKLVSGKSYIWDVQARGKDGAVLGSGRGFFEL